MKNSSSDLVSIDTNTLADVSGGWGWGGAYRAAALAAIANANGIPAYPYYVAPIAPVVVAPMFRRYGRR
ncbi:MAG TPA: hypothetical protein VGG28_13855 [Kofleriaceae bacterium]|jgi:hypothetical protein